MHLHILGICGTFMGGIAAIAKELGHKVTGSDLNVYPPMSTQLASLGIELTQGWSPEQFQPEPDLVIIGNALSRGNPAVEYVLNRNLPYCSGPEWLKQNLLAQRWVLAASGTHGKTTTASMMAWLLEDAGFEPGFLIGGVPRNFEVSARVGASPFFVIEADEYDTAFFDKRSKFVHYLPNTLVINNLEFDHADIFDDIGAIQKQFHHLIRTVPGNGLILAPKSDANVSATLEQGCWSDLQFVGQGGKWQAELIANQYGQQDGQVFDVLLDGQVQGRVEWSLTGLHNVQNGLMAIASVHHAGLSVKQAIASLCQFQSPKRRMELIYDKHQIQMYDDFAHHPTAIASTLEGLRKKVGDARIIAILEPRSNTMKMGVHKDTLGQSLALADLAFIYQASELDWQLEVTNCQTETQITDNLSLLVDSVIETCDANDHIVVMSNGGFAGIHQTLIERLDAKFS